MMCFSFAMCKLLITANNAHSKHFLGELGPLKSIPKFKCYLHLNNLKTDHELYYYKSHIVSINDSHKSSSQPAGISQSYNPDVRVPDK